jgi:folate-binding protein YgfZ
MIDERSDDDFWRKLEPTVQYASLGEGAGYVELTGWTNISVAGRDAKTFLNNFCTNDVKRLVPGQNCEAFFTNVKGKIIGHGMITCREDELVVVGVPEQAPRLIEHLSRYLIREDVEIRDRTSERVCLLFAGGSTARGFVMTLAPTISAGNAILQPQVNAEGKIVDMPVRWINWNLTGPELSGIIELAAGDSSRIKSHFAERSYTQCEMAIFHARRIEAGMPLFGVDFDESNFPQEVGRDKEAISFTKGCYLGQETVARIDALGHVNQRLVGVKFLYTDAPEKGAELKLGNTVVGNITSAAAPPRLVDSALEAANGSRMTSAIALAMVRREYQAIGTRLESAVGACNIVELPMRN